MLFTQMKVGGSSTCGPFFWHWGRLGGQGVKALLVSLVGFKFGWVSYLHAFLVWGVWGVAVDVSCYCLGGWWWWWWCQVYGICSGFKFGCVLGSGLGEVLIAMLFGVHLLFLQCWQNWNCIEIRSRPTKQGRRAPCLLLLLRFPLWVGGAEEGGVQLFSISVSCVCRVGAWGSLWQLLGCNCEWRCQGGLGHGCPF